MAKPVFNQRTAASGQGNGFAQAGAQVHGGGAIRGVAGGFDARAQQVIDDASFNTAMHRRYPEKRGSAPALALPVIIKREKGLKPLGDVLHQLACGQQFVLGGPLHMALLVKQHQFGVIGVHGALGQVGNQQRHIFLR